MHEEKTPEVLDERAMERLRQERETFEQHKVQANRRATLQLVMGYASIFILFLVVVVCWYVLRNNALFPTEAVKMAAAALFVDVLGLIVSVWKIVLNPEFKTQLAPVTKLLPDVSDDAVAISRPTSVVQEDLVIHFATWGSGDATVDVTKLLNSLISESGTLGVLASNETLGCDPIKGVVKTLIVTFSHADQTTTKKIPEGAMLYLP